MLVNHAQAGTEAVAIADASSASHALANSSAILESIQDHQDLVDAQGGKDGERKTCGMCASPMPTTDARMRGLQYQYRRGPPQPTRVFVSGRAR